MLSSPELRLTTHSTRAREALLSCLIIQAYAVCCSLGPGQFERSAFLVSKGVNIMRKLIWSFSLMLILCMSAMGQGGFIINKLEKINDEERGVLRKGFNLPDSATITEVKSKSFGSGVRLHRDDS
jgi:hypothetical protein